MTLGSTTHGAGHDHSAGDTAGAASAPATEAKMELDVRTLPHGQRHDIIFRSLDALSTGESLIIINDHDPKPLRYQTGALWPGKFEWTYREAGPAVWRVEITCVG